MFYMSFTISLIVFLIFGCVLQGFIGLLIFGCVWNEFSCVVDI